MTLSPKYIVVFWLFLALLLFVFPDFYLQAHGIAKLLFEGYSYGKLMAFLLWEIFFFAIIAFAPKLKFKHKFDPLQALGLAIFVGFIFGVVLQLGVNSMMDVSQHGYLGILTSFNGTETWEASHLGHIHLGKVAIAPFAELGLLNGAVDNGIPVFQMLPFASLFSVVFILIALAIAAFAFLEIQEKKISTHGKIILSVAVFASIVTIIDGGVFTQVGKIATGLIVLYWATEYMKGKTKFVAQLIFPLGAVLFIQTIFELFANYQTLWSTEPFVVLILSFFVIAYESIKELLKKRDNIEWGKLIVSLIFIYFLWQHLDSYLIDYSVGSYPSMGDEMSLFIYGIPQTATDSDVISGLSKYGAVSKFERWSWTARADLTVTNPTATNVMAEEMKEKLKPDSYFYILRLWEAQTIWVIDPTGNDALEKLDSEFVKVTKIKDIGGKRKIGVRTKMDPIWTSLYLLDYLKMIGRDEPLVLVTDWFE
ncbi:MAG: hypothetical protein JXA43_02300 [Candidatus Diapherotrites archaeon]|nr:hypothetical protein [Candidatus Diapherotrites archaeon]